MAPPLRPRAHGLATERRRRATTQATEAKAAGVERVTWARWEAGVSAPTDEQLTDIASRWGVTTAALLRAPSARRVKAADRDRVAARKQRKAAAMVRRMGPDAVRRVLDDL